MNNDTHGFPVEGVFDGGSPPSVRLAVEKYRSLLDGFDMSDEQANAFLALLWDIMCRFAQSGVAFDVSGYFSKLAATDETTQPNDVES